MMYKTIVNNFSFARPNYQRSSFEERGSRSNKVGWIWRCLSASCVPVVIFLLVCMIVLILLNIKKEYTLSTPYLSYYTEDLNCDDECNIRLVESIPEGLNFTNGSPKFMSTYEAWTRLLDVANVSLEIGSLYWTLRGVDVVNHSTAALGEEIFNRLLENANENTLNIRIAQSAPTPNEPNLDTIIFQQHGAADVRSVDFQRLLGNGVLHTKLWVVDNSHFYLGSANMDWRSLTQVKELGILVENCKCLARDVAKIFEAYWYLGTNTSTIPDQWSDELSTKYNWKNPLSVKFNGGMKMSTFLSSAPPALTSKGRVNDLDAILNIIATAKSFINIAVMDYFPLTIYTEPIKYWPFIDNELRKAAIERRVTVRMLISKWPHSRPSEDLYLRSLQSLSASAAQINIQIKRFIVPSSADQDKIPFARVNHNKYMVTDNTAYIGTSNWSGDYFTNTAGIGLIMRDIGPNAKSIRIDLVSVFQRDWESPYAFDLKET